MGPSLPSRPSKKLISLLENIRKDRKKVEEMSVLQTIRQVIASEAKAIQALVDQVDVNFDQAIHLLSICLGKVIVTGVGKSGLIGKKMAASFSSTGTPSFFLHSTEGVHGDSGMLEEQDAVILISNSGETAEVLNLLPILERLD